LEPPTEQWTWHAVDAVLRAHALLRATPGVDPRRIGATGISWGGFLASIVAGHDRRLRCVAPVYGCGGVRDSPGLGLDRQPAGIVDRWEQLWDPLRHVAGARMPMLWINGTNDFAFTPPMWRATQDLSRGRRHLTFLREWAHGHTEGQIRSEIHAFADAELRGARPLARAVEVRTDENRFHARFTEGSSLRRAELVWTPESGGPWPGRKWRETETRLHSGGKVVAEVPADAAAWFVNVVDDRRLVASTRWFSRS
jgi:dienelactone hydrolase